MLREPFTKTADSNDTTLTADYMELVRCLHGYFGTCSIASAPVFFLIYSNLVSNKAEPQKRDCVLDTGGWQDFRATGLRIVGLSLAREP